MSRSWEGGCACGAVRYEADDTPIVELHCQCRDCQRRSGTGHGSYVTFPARSRVSITGDAKSWRVAGDSGAFKDHAFCPTCGTPVWLTFPASPEVIAVHASTLDEPGRFSPQMVVYRASAQPWDAIDPALTAFERMPAA